MRGSNRQLARLYADLTAKERALAVLKAWKSDEQPDAAIVSTMPPAQVADYNRYLDVLLATIDLEPDIMLLQQFVVELELRYEQLLFVRLRAVEVGVLGAYIIEHIREPVTATAFAERRATLRSELVPAAEFAELLAERLVSEQAEQDVTFDGARPRPVSRAQRWRRLVADDRRELEKLVATGTLRGVRQGRRVVIEAGSFYDWLGEKMPVFSEGCTDYDVRPDADAARVAQQQQALRDVRQILAMAPRPSLVPVGIDRASADDAAADAEPDWVQTLATTIRDGVQTRWAELRLIEIIVDEIAHLQFDGEDPLWPARRSRLDDCRRRLAALRAGVQSDVGDFELPEPGPQDIEAFRRIVQWRVDRPPRRSRS